ncbi:MAG: DUF982 domain-containing protein [Rhizobiaceae bacterium]|nr:DUF982 domain-containing protein [Rhizobiaceae bacterium]
MNNEVLWNSPVTVMIGSAKYIVKNTSEAAWLLADKWPDVAGKPFVRALKACAAATDGRRPASYSRLALIAAARDANIPTS